VRLWLLPARDAPIVAIFRRGPSPWWHVVRWNTHSNEVEHGAWHKWTLNALDTDISPDGEYVTVSLGYWYGGGIASLPSLEPKRYWDLSSAWYSGGAYFESNDQLATWYPGPDSSIIEDPSLTVARGIDRPFHVRLNRDGWHRQDGLWTCRSEGSPGVLMLRERVPIPHAIHDLEFQVEGLPKRINAEISFAWHDGFGCLLIVRDGVIERYTQEEFQNCKPGQSLDLRDLYPTPEPTTVPLIGNKPDDPIL
jgi:hypothetical protein